MPEMARKLEALRTYIRAEASLPQRLQELVMISVAREMNCAFIWYAHAAAARQAECAMTSWTGSARSAPWPTSPPRNRSRSTSPANSAQPPVSRPTFEAATARFGQRGAMTLTNLIACYAVLAYDMNTYDLEAPAHPTEKALTGEAQP